MSKVVLETFPADDLDEILMGPAVVLAAEPGDEVAGAGSAIHALVRRGELPLVVLLRSASAERDLHHVGAMATVDELATLAAAEVLGYGKPIFWRDSTSSLTYGEKLVKKLLSFIQNVGAAIVYAPSSAEPRADRFALALAAREAVRRCGTSCALVSYGIDRPAAGRYAITDNQALLATRDALACFRDPSLTVDPRPLFRLAPSATTDGAALVAQKYQRTIPAREIAPLAGMAASARWRSAITQAQDSLVSVVVRTTGRKELEMALDSVALQTYRHIEILLVDVLGQDMLAAPSRCGQFELRTVSAGKKLTRGAAANVGVNAARGAYVMLLDDDDWLQPDHVFRLVTILRADTGCRAAYSGIDCRTQSLQGEWDRVKVFNDQYDDVRLLVENYIPMHAVLFDRRLFGNSLRFDESLPVYEDWDFWVQLSQQTPFCHVDQITAIYRISTSGGFGVRSSDPAIAIGTKLFFEKWQRRWTPDQLVALIQYQKRQVARTQDQLERLTEEREAATTANAALAARLDRTTRDLHDTVSQRDAEIAEYVQRLEQEQRASKELRLQLALADRTAASRAAQLRGLKQRYTRVCRRLNDFQYGATWPLAVRLHALESAMPALVRRLMRIAKVTWWATSFKVPRRLRQHAEAQRILASGLLNESWYIEHTEDALLKGYRAIVHWMTIGRHRGDNPCALFDVAWYRGGAGLPVDADIDPLLHYLEHSDNPPAEPNPLFDTAWYRSHVDRTADARLSPLAHYIHSGWMSGLSPHPLFDTQWYLQRYPHVLAEGWEPLSHYLETGAYDGCDPHPLFHSAWYLKENPDVAHSGMNPLVHFLQFGASEGRNPNPLFDSKWYAARNQDVSSEGMNPLVHFVVNGAAAMCNPHRGFDLAAYSRAHPELPAHGVALLTHHFDQLPVKKQPPGPFEATKQDDPKLLALTDTVRPRDYLLSARVNDGCVNRVAALVNSIHCAPSHGGLEPALIKRMTPLLHDIDNVTFDLFDTLIERRVSEPADIFWLVGLAYYGNLREAERYANARVEAELEARRQSPAPEVDMKQIMHELKQSLDFSDHEIAQVQQLELHVEAKAITVKPEGRLLYQLAATAGKRISILTDTYLPAGVIDSLVAGAGYDQPSENNLYISNTRGATKHDGSLFVKWLSAADERTPARALHIGDNEHSDVDSARANGLRTLPVASSRTAFFSNPLAGNSWPDAFAPNLAWRLSLGLVIHRWSTLRPQASSTAAYLGNPYLLGYATLGPLLLGFVSGLLDFARRRDTSEFYFLSRDGYMLQAAYDEVARCSNRWLPPSKYIAASRALCSAASVDSVDEVLRVASVAHFPMSLNALLQVRFGLSEPELAKIPRDLYCQHGCSNPNELMHEDDPRKARVFEALAPLLIEASRLRAEHYKAYLQELNISESAAVVDIGYAGTAQRVMSRLLAKPIDAAYLITSERIITPERDGLYCEGWLAERAPLDHPFFKHVQLWEMFLSASHGSIIDVAPRCGSWPDFTFDNNLFDEAVRASLSVIHRGAFDFVRDFMQEYGEHFDVLSFDPDAFSRPLTAFFSAPDASDCRYLAPAVLEDKYGGDVRVLAAPVKHACQAMSATRRALVWPEATRVLSAEQAESTPFYPVSPVHSARARGWLDRGPAFIDGFDAKSITPAWRSDVYTTVFSTDGWPRGSVPDVSIRLMVPVADPSSDPHAVVDSWHQFIFGGVAVTVAAIGATAGQFSSIPLLSKKDDLAQVATWSELNKVLDRTLEPWVLLTDGYTTLEPTTPGEIGSCIREHPDADVIMFDEDWVDAGGCRHTPHFKPGWSPELLLSTDYFGGAFAVRAELLRGIQTQSETASGWMWEIALTVTEKTDRVVRIPRVLAHRAEVGFKRELSNAQRDAERTLRDRFRRLGAAVSVDTPEWASDAGRLACQPRFPDTGPDVAIIIPTKNQHAITKRCIDSLARTTYHNYQIYLVDNDSDDADALAYFSSLQETGIRVLRVSSPPNGFSYSYVNNRAVEQTQGEPYLLFLNNDTEVISPAWLSQMVGWMRLPGVGSVGARLLFANGTIQHAGITHKLLYNVLPAPSLKCEAADQGGYQDYVYLNRDSAAQTAACLLTSREIFMEQGMFDETHFSVAYNDCDYGFRLTQGGLRNVYCADAVLYHHEGYSRGVGRGNDKPSEEAAFVRKYINWEDPFYNPNLGLGRTDFALRPTAALTGETPRLRVAVFSHNLNYEGAPRVLMDISSGLQEGGQMEILVLSPADGALRAAYEDAGCAIHIVPAARDAFRSDQHGFQAVTEIAARLLAERVDVVIANTVLCWWAVEAADMACVPSIWVIHESEPPFTHLAEHGPDCERRGRQALALPYRVVFVSEATRAVFAHLETINNFTVFHNGYDATSDHESALAIPKAQARADLNIPVSAFVGLLPGTVIDRKSQIDLVHAVRLLDIDVARNLHLIILGDRPSAYSEALHREIALLDPVRRQCLSVLPYAPGAEQYFRAADFMISTSRIEAFPRVVQEAMFFELPMIVAPVYGIVEQVSDEVSALFFPPGDAARLAQQVERLFWCSALRERLAANARVTLNRFPTVAEMVRFYATITHEAWSSV